MKLTPIDIRKWEFRKAMRGYDKYEVDAFLEAASVEFERLLQERREFEQRCKRLEGDIEEYKRVEKSLQETLISAKETTDRSMENSRKESDLLISEAEIKAEKILDESRKRARAIEEEVTRLQVQKEAFVARMRSLLNSQIEILQIVSEEIPDIADPGPPKDIKITRKSANPVQAAPQEKPKVKAPVKKEPRPAENPASDKT